MSRRESEGLIVPEQDDGIELASSKNSGKTQEISKLVVGGDTTDDVHNSGRETDGEASEELEPALTEDCYSLIYTGSPQRPAFYFAIVMFLFQLSIQILIMIDLTSQGDSNWAKLPAGVDLQVEFAQILGLVLIAITIAVTGDITIGLAMFLDGYDESVLEKNPWATKSTWAMSSLFQIFVGTLMTSVFFLLLVQSTSTIGLMLNFAALAFVQEIDELAFQLGKRGYLGISISEDCARVSEHMIPKQKRKHRRLRPIVFCVLLITLIVPYFWLTKRRWDGDFVCQSVSLQFGDGFVFQYGYLSGVFNLRKEKNYDRRHVYQDTQNRVKFAYCEDSGKWTLSFVAKSEKADKSNACSNHFMESAPTKTYDLLDLEHATWNVFDLETFQYHPADRFFMQCADCKDENYGDNCFGAPVNVCRQINGEEVCTVERDRQCIEGTCVCNEDSPYSLFGLYCEFLEPCETLNLDAQTLPFAGDEFDLPSNFTLLRNTDGRISAINERPVYISSVSVFPDDQAGRALLIYLGRRWAITLDFFVFQRFDFCWQQNWSSLNESIQTCDLPSDEDLARFLYEKGDSFFDATEEELRECLRNSTEEDPLMAEGEQIFELQFFCRFFPYVIYYLSAPFDIGTPSDSATPADAAWYLATKTNNDLGLYEPDEREAVYSSLLCSVCDTYSNDCLNGGKCDLTTRECDCPDYYKGSRCEKELTCLDEGLDCHGNSTCLATGLCDCPASFFGILCENSV